jgi:formamidopyrimidine-DNA glycosylase
MPELPEVEVVRTGLHREIVGKKIKSCAVDKGHMVRRHKTVKDFRALIEGRSVKSVHRLGRNLAIALDNGQCLIIDLGTTGYLLKAKNAKEVKAKHTHVVIAFSTGEELRYLDPHVEGELYVAGPLPEGQEVEISKFARLSVGGDGLELRKRVPALAHLGVDPFEDQIGWDRFAAILRSRQVGLREVLTNQNIMAGIGPIYCDEILFGANLSYDRAADTLSTIEIRRLHRTIPEILTDAIKAGGTSVDGISFLALDGQPGSYQDDLQVYGRDGQPCPTCRTPIAKVLVNKQATYFCPRCQMS